MRTVIDAIGNWLVVWWPMWTPLLVAIIYGAFAVINRRGTEKHKNRQPAPPTWPEMWQRIDKLEKKVTAVTTAYNNLREVFTDYIERVQSGGSPELTNDERDRLEALPELE